MKREVTLAQTLALPIALSKTIIEKDLPARTALKMAEDEGLFDEYKGPFCSDVKASCVFDDIITVDCFREQKQPDGTYLITYSCKYIEKYKLSLYIRVLTSGIKRKLKYHPYPNGKKLKIKGDLDMYICDTLPFDRDGDFLPDKIANLGVTITIIDFL